MIGCEGNCNQGRRACDCAISFPVLRETQPGELLPESDDIEYPVGVLQTWLIAFALVVLCFALVVGPQYAEMLWAAR